MSSRSQNTSSLLFASLPMAAILAPYMLFVLMFPTEISQQIEKLEEQRNQLQVNQVTPQSLAQISKQIAEQEKTLESLNSRFSKLRVRATKVVSAQIDSVEELQAIHRVNEVLRRAGLVTVTQSNVTDNNSKLLQSLDTVTKQLGTKLKEISESEVADIPVALPANLSPDISPEQWIAQQRQSFSSSYQGPSTRHSELQLVGNYGSMLHGLQEIATSHPDVVVTSVSFEKPENRNIPGNSLVWNLRLQMRSNGLDDSQNVPSAVVETAVPKRAGQPDGVEQQKVPLSIQQESVDDKAEFPAQAIVFHQAVETASHSSSSKED